MRREKQRVGGMDRTGRMFSTKVILINNEFNNQCFYRRAKEIL